MVFYSAVQEKFINTWMRIYTNLACNIEPTQIKQSCFQIDEIYLKMLVKANNLLTSK